MARAVLVLLAWHPDLIVPTLTLHVAAVGIWKYQHRPRAPAPHPCVRASMVEAPDREELDEEFDTIPSAKSPEVVRQRYVRDLLGRMTLQEKAGQMAQIELSVASPRALAELGVGSLLNGGDRPPFDGASPSDWAGIVDSMQRLALSSRLSVLIIYGVDAVHDHKNVIGATIFPHNVGLGASRDPELVRKIGEATALEVRATGMHWTFAPCVAVCRDSRWGRCYESYSEDPEIVRSFTTIVVSLQGQPPADHPHGYPFLHSVRYLIQILVLSDQDPTVRQVCWSEFTGF
ncbi:beta-glucosidase BoGH3B-like [Hordeum vulgare subsp. vulgare]|uniref:beta-glucosidase BoGH3B-like n=1 Tax=Hordeum vulgare subsp. vulgare TaxID=112509 RepID=UPI001D1A3D5A|nr:beta-glucosidase BoGH3B-like [Hordeum vulgare subsp. vulgare]